MDSTLRFSAIIVFYNQRDFVRTAMDSVLSQAADGLEVIAVDDGSTDGTREVLSEYRDRARLVLFGSEPRCTRGSHRRCRSRDWRTTWRISTVMMHSCPGQSIRTAKSRRRERRC